ncbi:MAG: purine-nucleoside phosphorylase [Saprospiraceae bacterium]
MIYEQIQETIDFIRRRTDFEPQVGLVLGTGLSTVAEALEVEREFTYNLLPHFPLATVESHKGKLIFGRLNGVPVVAMAGRFHYYEGYSMHQVTFPIRVMKYLGIKHLFISNAAGSVNASMEAGDVVFLRDHINLQPDNPLRGVNDEQLGPRFPDMLRTYDKALNGRCVELAKQHGLTAHQGVYLAIPGPNLETPAEYEMAHRLGADLIGMSTVPEVLVARHMGLPVTVLSVVSNKCYPIESIEPTTVDTVIATVQAVEPKIKNLMEDVIGLLAQAGEPAE